MPLVKTLFALAAVCSTLLLAAGEKYSAIYISDSHLGPESCYDMSKNNPCRTKKDIKRDDATKEYYNAMLKHIADHKGDNAKMILCGGDLIEGGTYGEEVHTKTFQDAIDRVRTGAGLPLYFTNGNHDDWGVGGPAAFDKVSRKFLPSQTIPVTFGKGVGINYFFEVGGDLYVVGDYHTRKSNWINFICERIAQVKPGQYRYIFVLVHPGVLCGDQNSRPIVEALAQAPVKGGVILCGHSHQNMILRYESPKGKVSQLIMATMVGGSKKDTYRNSRAGVETYWAGFQKSADKAKSKKAKAKNLRKLAKSKENKEVYGPYLKDYFEVTGNGYAKLEISDEGITVTMQSANLEQEPIVKPLM